jgi:N-ethylmaleimide reductase
MATAAGGPPLSFPSPLPNRIVMAPLTRMRASSTDHVTTDFQATYYAQRASAALIIAEGAAI